MTDEEFVQQEEYVLKWYRNASTNNERKVAFDVLNNLQQLRPTMIENPCGEMVLPRPVPIPITKMQKFDQKNRRRAAILAQRAKA